MLSRDCSEIGNHGPSRSIGRRRPWAIKNRSGEKSGSKVMLKSVNRSGGIRTHDPHYPKVVRYQAALRPDRRR